jgi:hypothetical protein
MSMSLHHPLVLLLLACALFLNGCAKPFPMSEFPKAGTLWARFLDRSAPLPAQDGFSLRGSINYASPERKHRVLVQIWGNPEYPIRADIRAGIGTHMAYLREDRLSSIAYFPQRNQAYLSEGRGVHSPEISLPFSLMELSAICLNAWGTILPEHYLSASIIPGTGWAYRFDDPRIDTLIVGLDGRPLSLHGSNGGDWELAFQSWSSQGGRNFPNRMFLTLTPREKAVISFKELAMVPGRWPDAALELPLPPDASIVHDPQPMEVP